MKRNVALIVLPIVAGLALIGTGFGAWVFSNNVSSASSALSINVTTAINVTGLTVKLEEKFTDVDNVEYAGDSITLDQTHEADMTVAFHFEAEAQFLNGITLTASNSMEDQYQDADHQNSYSYKASTNDAAADTTKYYEISYSANYNFKITEGLSDYIADPDGTGHLIGTASESDKLVYSYSTTEGWKLHSTAMEKVKYQTFAWKEVSKDASNRDGKKYHTETTTHTSHTAGAESDTITSKPECMQEYNNMIDTISNHTGALILELNDFEVYDVVVKNVA